MLARVRKRNRGPLSNKSLEAIYREIMSAALSLEGALVIGVAGDGAAAVARNLFGASATYAMAAAPTSAVDALCAGRWHALCIMEAHLPAACGALQDGRIRVCGKAVGGVAVLVRGGA